MRITSFRASKVARILAIIYGIFGFAYVPTLLLVGAKQMVVPIGIVAPMVFLNFNLRFAPPSGFIGGVFSTVAAVFCYAITGWLTGTAAVLVFNFVARRMGGIDASILVKDSLPGETAAS
jgi:hypothetical protein